MKKIGFIGVYDKTDFIVYIAKILTEMNKKVLVMDTTVNQKAKYIIPVINPTKSYVTDYEGIDVAVGFENFEGVKRYLGLNENEELDYDVVLMDIDSTESFDKFNMTKANKNYFVTSFDLYSLKKGLEIMSNIQESIFVTKILFSKEMLKEEDDYLNFLSVKYKINWNEEIVYFPYERGDSSTIIENQRVAKIKFKDLTEHYKESLILIASEVLPEMNESEIRRTFKNIEKGV